MASEICVPVCSATFTPRENALARRRDIIGEKAFGDTDGDAGKARRRRAAVRHVEHRRGVEFCARARCRLPTPSCRGCGAPGRNFFDHEGVAAGAGHTDRAPVVDDLDVALRHQHRARLLAIAVIDAAGGHHPLRVIDAAGEGVASRPDHAAIDRTALADRRHAIGKFCGRVLAPDSSCACGNRRPA